MTVNYFACYSPKGGRLSLLVECPSLGGWRVEVTCNLFGCMCAKIVVNILVTQSFDFPYAYDGQRLLCKRVISLLVHVFYNTMCLLCSVKYFKFLLASHINMLSFPSFPGVGTGF